MTKSNQSLGAWGEDIACKYLERKGYKIVERNFRRKWGEIDIVCLKDAQTNTDLTRTETDSVPRGTSVTGSPDHKIRASKGVLRGTLEAIGRFFGTREETSVPHVENLRKSIQGQTIVFVEVKTLQPGLLRPEDNITPAKMRKLIRSCELYLASKNYNLDEIDWQIDTIGIVVDKAMGRAKINHLEQAVYL